ncbi:MAG: hypothetical protein DRO23_00680 [Thermoprotei archaeon]|nr:MAG: hypothetical protein DRO23_00680 [Thermoprotei archaeon]
MGVKVTKGERKYLTYLYEVEAYGGKRIGTTKIAKALNVSPPTAVEALQKLHNKGLVDFVKRKGVRLTGEGVRIVRRILRKHRILEILFFNSTRLPLEEICQCIEKIDVEIDDKLVDKIYVNLGMPKFCPHGKEIPQW